MIQKLIITIFLGILFGLYYIQPQNQEALGDGVGLGTLPVFNVISNAILPRVATWDFAIGNSTSSASADFSVDPGNNTLNIRFLNCSANANGGALTADANGLITCSDDNSSAGGSGSSLQIREGYSGSFLTISSLSFNAPHFILNSNGTHASLSLDWGTGGPASLSQDETISGNWVNTANPWADNEVVDTITASNYLLLTGGTLLGNLIGTNASFSFGEFSTQASASLYKGSAFPATNCTSAGQFLRWATSGLFTCGTIADADIPDTITASNYLLLTGGTLTGNLIGTNASFSYGEFTTYASASAYKGSAFPASNCTSAGQFLRWATSGIYTCGTISDADVPDTITASNYQLLDSTLTALAGYNTNGILTQTSADTFTGRTITGTASQITVSNGDGVSGNPTLSLPALLSLTRASLSADIEIGGYASIATILKIPEGLAPTVAINGATAIDTSGFGQLVYYASGSAHTLTDEKTMMLSIGSTSFSSFASRSLGYMFRGRTIKRIQCKTASATSVQINLSSNGTSDMDTLTCATTNTFDDGSIANATITKGNDLVLERRTISGEADYLQITITYADTRE